MASPRLHLITPDAADYLPATPRLGAGAPLSVIGDNDADTTLFQQPWWLDAVSDGRYRTVTAGDGENAFIWLPYMEHGWSGMRVVGGPPMTHTLGPVIRLPPGKAVSQASQRRKLIETALSRLPGADGFFQVLGPGSGLGIDFSLAGYEVNVRYTYRITNTCEPEALWAAMKDKARNTVRRAREQLSIHERLSPMEFYALYQSNLARHGRTNHHNAALYQRLADALEGRGRHRILTAVDRLTGDVAASVMLLWDAHTLYYFRATRDPSVAGAGASSLLLWEAILMAADMGLAFDSDSYLGRRGALFIEAFGAEPAERLAVSKRSLGLKLSEAIARRVPGAPTPGWL